MGRAARDINYQATMLGIDSNDTSTVTPPYVDSATGRLLVTAVVTAGATTATEYTEGDTDTTFSGIMLLGEGPSDTAIPFSVDANGKLEITAQVTEVTPDSVYAGGDGPQVMAVRNDTLASLVDTDGDVAPLQVNASGALYVDIGSAGTLTVDGSGVTQPISASALPLPSGAATAANQSTANGILTTIGADTSVLAGAVSGTEMQVDIVSSAAIPVTDNGGSLTVDGTVTANLGATDNAVLDSIDAAVSSKEMTGIGHGVKTITTAGTDEALATSTACKRVTIMAQTDNTGLVAIGGSGVDATEATGTGVLLAAGEAFEVDINNLASIYIDATVNGEGVRYTYLT